MKAKANTQINSGQHFKSYLAQDQGVFEVVDFDHKLCNVTGSYIIDMHLPEGPQSTLHFSDGVEPNSLFLVEQGIHHI